MSEKKIIIGEGVAGLSAGCYAQMNGYNSVIFELHDLPGGLCTAWERNGYVFDGCVHYLFGSGEDQPFNQLSKSTRKGHLSPIYGCTTSIVSNIWGQLIYRIHNFHDGGGCPKVICTRSTPGMKKERRRCLPCKIDSLPSTIHGGRG